MLCADSVPSLCRLCVHCGLNWPSSLFPLHADELVLAESIVDIDGNLAEFQLGDLVQGCVLGVCLH